MRRLLVAGFAALAVVLGLVVSAGVASAAPGDHDRGGPCTVDGGGAGFLHLGVCVAVGVGVGGTTVVPCPAGQHRNHAGVCVADGVGFPGDGDHHGNGGPWGGGYGGGWGGPHIDGRYLWLDQNLSLDVCSDSTYGGWYSRNLSHRDGILRLLGGNPNARWLQLHSSSCGSGVSVSNDGQCVTFRQEATRFGNDLNANRRDWSGLRLRLLDVHRGWNGTDLNLLSLSERNDWNRLSGLDRDRFNSYNRVYGQLRTICNDPNPPVVIVQAPAPVTYALPAPSGNDAASNPPVTAPAPLAAGPVPSGAVQTGGDSAAFVLAHNRAV